MNWRTAVVLVIAAGGCDRVLGLTEREPDAAPPLIDAQSCFGSGTLALCLVEPTPDELVYVAGTMTTIDTTPSAMSSCLAYTGGEPDLCVIGATTLRIDGELKASGPRPLVLVGSTVTITGTVTVASNAFAAGAGAQPDECMFGSAATAVGGGGSGEMIVIDVQTFALGPTAGVFANGGGGGEGGGTTTAGRNGESPSVASTAALGGINGTTGGGQGGNGSAGATLFGGIGRNGNAVSGGGGGGGGAGVIRFVKPPTGSAVVSPAPT